MLRSLGTNVQRSIRPTLVSRPFMGTLHPRFSPITLSSRCLSSSVAPQLKTTESAAPLVSQTKPKSTKVDLNPKPIKVVAKPATRSIPPVPPAPTQAALDALEKEAQSVEPSALKTAKNDIIEATHGVFAPAPEGANKIQKLWHTAKEFFRFYWNGIKLINQHRKEWAVINERIQAGGAPLTWSENQFGITYRKDVIKMVPFLIIVLVLEEVIPLIAIYLPGMLPSTCILPSQRERIETKAAERQSKWWTESKELFQAASTNVIAGSPQIPSEVAKPVSGLLRLSTWGPSSLNAWRVRRHLEKIAQDDVLLQTAVQKSELSADEKLSILKTRGFVTTGFEESEISQGVEWWLKNVGAGGSSEAEVAQRLRAVLEIGSRAK